MIEAAFLTVGTITALFDFLSPLITSFLNGPAKARANKLIESKKRQAIKLLQGSDDLDDAADKINSIIDSLKNTYSDRNKFSTDINNKIDEKINEFVSQRKDISNLKSKINSELNSLNDYNVTDKPVDLYDLGFSNQHDPNTIKNFEKNSQEINDSIFKWKEKYNEKF